MNRFQNILIIEDEVSISDNIEYALTTEGFWVVSKHTGFEGIDALENNLFDLVILDIGLPDMIGFEVFKEIRKKCDIPVIFLTARDSEVDKIVGLEMGGDDYVTKPFSPRELTARVRAVLRRVKTAKKIEQKPIDENGSKADVGLAMNSDAKQIYYCGKLLDLSHYEYEILSLLMKEQGKVFSRKELMGTIWDVPEMSMARTVDTHIKTIRAKLGQVKPNTLIQTRRGFGYFLSDEKGLLDEN